MERVRKPSVEEQKRYNQKENEESRLGSVDTHKISKGQKEAVGHIIDELKCELIAKR